MTNIFSRISAAARSIFASGVGREGGVLAYHSVDKNGLATTVTPQEFERQMSYLKQKRYRVISLPDMYMRLSEGLSVKGCVAITFDDGYSDFFANAFPILKRNNFPATIFLISGKLGHTFSPDQGKTALRIMSEGDVKRASTANGLLEFMPHTESHRALPDLHIIEAAREMNESRKRIEDLTGKPADILAYPMGRYTSEIVDYLEKSGAWLGAVTLDEGTVSQSPSPFMLRRIAIDAHTTLPIFKKKLNSSRVSKP